MLAYWQLLESFCESPFAALRVVSVLSSVVSLDGVSLQDLQWIWLNALRADRDACFQSVNADRCTVQVQSGLKAKKLKRRAAIHAVNIDFENKAARVFKPCYAALGIELVVLAGLGL